MASSQFSEAARTGGCIEDGCNPGKEAPCWGPQWLVFPWQAPNRGAGDPNLGGQRPGRQQFQAKYHSQRQVSRGNMCTCRQWSYYCWLQETVENKSVFRQNPQKCGFVLWFRSVPELAIQSLAATVHPVLKCPWARHSTLTCSWLAGQCIHIFITYHYCLTVSVNEWMWSPL